MYRLEISQIAHRQVRKLPVSTRERINKAIAGLGENPRRYGTRKLTAGEGYRVRAGDYRILYKVDDEARTVIIYRVMSRDDVYRF
ncbi:MAG: type II toxin-antitoxin system RelE/ParE family toxin [Dehalococcoidia bacterium]